MADLPTTAVKSATSSLPPLTIAVGNDANDGEAGNTGPASTTQGGLRKLCSPDIGIDGGDGQSSRRFPDDA